ncbi:hypothetical protein TpMuguga_04g02425 [Theileria parva strain Muguga]|uniref:uncharacterized protein n=1 Tax=Theileria parva strain Muguga TaxID=333668 RepID=UPI001C622F08|nr:uncharacterized protein TpMuguga_04g02425 [Theileria parva strain Muguga]KAF5153179.1 hypothetical protein TpMuguga_04g02425 [Theileria parva strain Muguga]
MSKKGLRSQEFKNLVKLETSTEFKNKRLDCVILNNYLHFIFLNILNKKALLN